MLSPLAERMLERGRQNLKAFTLLPTDVKPRRRDIEVSMVRFKKVKPRFEDLTRRLGEATSPEQRSAIRKEMDDILGSVGIGDLDREIMRRVAGGETYRDIAADMVNPITGRPYAQSTIGDLHKRALKILGGSREDLAKAHRMGRIGAAEPLKDVEGRLPETKKLGLKKKPTPLERAYSRMEELTDEWMRESQKKNPDRAKLERIEEEMVCSMQLLVAA